MNVEVVDFQDVVESFGVAEEGFLEGFDDESEAFLEESERAGNSRPLLYIDDNAYEGLSTSRGIGAIDDSIPVRVLPKQSDLFNMLERYSFAEGLVDVLEGDRALFVNPGEMRFNGRAHLSMGKEVAQNAYDRAVSGPKSIEYLEAQRGVGVMYMPDGGFEIQVDEDRMGREFDYSENGNLSLNFGNEEVLLEYDQVQSIETDGLYKFLIQ